MNWDNLTEEQRIAMINGSDVNNNNSTNTQTTTTMHPSLFAAIKQQKHATEYLKTQQQQLSKKPPTDYVCFGCHERGDHYRNACPKQKDKKFVPYDRRKMPIGIPKSRIRVAKTEEELKRAFVNQEGQFVVFD
jgi:hypothetical protein